MEKDENKSGAHPAMINQDKHVSNLKSSIDAKRTTAAQAESDSIKKKQAIKESMSRSRNAKDSGKREKGYN